MRVEMIGLVGVVCLTGSVCGAEPRDMFPYARGIGAGGVGSYAQVDFDGDGDLDFIASRAGVLWLHRNSAGAFSSELISNDGGRAIGAQAAGFL